MEKSLNLFTLYQIIYFSFFSRYFAKIYFGLFFRQNKFESLSKNYRADLLWFIVQHLAKETFMESFSSLLSENILWIIKGMYTLSGKSLGAVFSIENQ